MTNTDTFFWWSGILTWVAALVIIMVLVSEYLFKKYRPMLVKVPILGKKIIKPMSHDELQKWII